jgi:hypothetical protein
MWTVKSAPSRSRLAEISLSEFGFTPCLDYNRHHLGTMSFSQPATHAEQRLKYACEECHSRKIRCYASTKTQPGTCTPCHENGRKCLFALKNKTGRPRRMAQQQSMSKPNDPTTQEWEQASMEWERRPELLRHQSDRDYDYRNSGRFTYFEDQLPPLNDRPPTFSPRLHGPSMAMYDSSAPRSRELRHESPRMLDYEVDCMPGTELSNLFHTGPLSNASSGSSSDIMSQDCFSMSLMATAPESAPLPSATLTDLSSTGTSSYSDLAADTIFNQAFETSQQIHRRFIQIRSQAFDSTNKYDSEGVCQTLESFDVLAKLLKQRIAGHKQNPHSGGLPAMVISGVLYVAVLQAIMIATVLLQSDGPESSNDRTSNNNNNNNNQYDRRRSPAEDQSSLSSPQSIGNLECILNLTKMEYYISVFNQYLQLFFCVNNADPNASPQGHASVFDYTACIDTTESVQSRVRLLLSQSRQAMH